MSEVLETCRLVTKPGISAEKERATLAAWAKQNR